MAKLYVIGNGFDLHYRLKTSPKDFKNILKTKDIYNEVENAYDVMDTYGVNWSGYEESLAYIDLEEIENQHLGMPDYLSDHESDRDGVILNMQMYLNSIDDAMSSALEDMIKRADIEVQKRVRLSKKYYPFFCDGDAILSFNYTSTVENLFYLPEDILILHIHGFYDDNEPLIFGYKNGQEAYESKPTSSDEDGDYYVDQQRELIYDFYKGWKKNIQMDILNDFLEKCQKIDQVVVLGHSMGEVDSDYMEQIEKILHPDIWYVSYHDDDSVKSNSESYSFFSKVRFFEW